MDEETDELGKGVQRREESLEIDNELRKRVQRREESLEIELIDRLYCR
jgi:hypothetical protein